MPFGTIPDSPFGFVGIPPSNPALVTVPKRNGPASRHDQLAESCENVAKTLGAIDAQRPLARLTARRELFGLAVRIQAATQCHEIDAYLLAKRERPDLHRIMNGGDAKELHEVFEEMKMELERGGTAEDGCGLAGVSGLLATW
jgi:hypothetical protein